MPAMNQGDALIRVQLTSDQKNITEDAAIATGQSIGAFAISTLAQAARKILDEQQTTRLSARDREASVALLDDEASTPNKALTKATACYKKQVGQ